MSEMASRVRRCFVCRNRGAESGCTDRVFLTPGELEDPPPRCQHGPMVREPNRRYFGRSTPR